MKFGYRKTPTDLKILQCIYDEYYQDFIQYDSVNEKNNNRITKIFMPINCEFIAKKLKIDGDIVFGRLYYYLDHQHSQPEKNISFFVLALGSDNRKHINFPLLASILAKLQDDEKRYKANLRTNKLLVIITLLAACAAIASALAAVFK